MQDRTRSQMLEDIVTNLANYLATGQIPKPYRRGSWRPIGHMRPSSPLLDSVRDLFEGYDQLSKDFSTAFAANAKMMCDVAFNVVGGQSSNKTSGGTNENGRRVYGVRALLAIRSRVFLEMLYGFSPIGAAANPVASKDPSSTLTTSSSAVTNVQSQRKQSKVGVEKKRRSSVTAETIHKIAQIPKLMSEKKRKESIRATPTYLTVPTNTSGPSAPSSSGGIKGAISRLVSGSWSGWGSKNRQESFKRWQSESIYATNATEGEDMMNGLSICADLAKIDRVKLAQTEFTIIEFDGDTFQLLIEYLHSGFCCLTCETVPGLICAAEHFDLPDLLQACFHHTKTHMRLSVCPSMLNQLENYYWRYNSASQLVNTIFKFIDPRAGKFFQRNEYLTLSESMFTSLISRPTLNVNECKKFQVMLKWATNRVRFGPSVTTGRSYIPTALGDQVTQQQEPLPNLKKRELQVVMNRLTRDLKLHKIPANELITVSNGLLDWVRKSANLLFS